MKSILHLLLIMVPLSSFAQLAQMKLHTQKLNGHENLEDIDTLETTILEIDLSKPTKNSLRLSNRKKRLVFNSDKPLAIKLINGNPFKYSYSLSYNAINLFSNYDFSLDPLEIESLAENQEEEEEEEVVLKSSQEIKVSEQKDSISVKEILTEQTKLIEKTNEVNGLLGNELNKFSSLDTIDYMVLENLQESTAITISNCETEIIQIKEKIKELKEAPKVVNSNLKLIEKLFNKTKIEYKKLFFNTQNTFLLPIDVFGDNIDYVEITLHRTSRETSATEEYTYKLWLTGGIKIDFSAGGFISSLKNKSYTLVSAAGTNQTETGNVIYEDDNGDYGLSFGAVANIVFRAGGWIKPCLSIGTILNSEQDFQVLVGGGFILGKNERFIFHTGLAMGNVTSINNRFKADGTSFYSSESTSAGFTVKKFDFGHFFGISYNIGSSKKE